MDIKNLEPLADEILHLIRKDSGRIWHISDIEKRLKAGSEDILKSLGILQNLGYQIKRAGQSQISFASAPDTFIPEEIAWDLKTEFLGRRIIAYKKIQSTNLVAHSMAVSGAAEGTMIVAEEQKRGRGRFGRSWHSPPGLGLYFSVILKPKIPPAKAPGLSLIAAAAVVDTINDYTDNDAKIKWPNDILVKGKKTAGILTELSAEIGRTNFVIVGIGVNINHTKNDIPAEIADKATSLRISIGKKLRRVEFLQNLLLNLENEYILFKKYGLDRIRDKILKYSSLLGSDVDLKEGRKTISGRVLDIDMEGRLVVDVDGEIRVFTAGEVTTH